MPTSAEHLEKARHNEEFVTALLAAHPKRFFDWALNGAFYAAVHYVEAVLAEVGYHSCDHGDRGRAAQRHFQQGYRPFRILKDLSMRARYQCAPVVPGDYETVAGKHLAEIRRKVQAKIRAAP